MPAFNGPQSGRESNGAVIYDFACEACDERGELEMEPVGTFFACPRCRARYQQVKAPNGWQLWCVVRPFTVPSVKD